ncbi:MAG: DUF2059 domain-containing protein [Pseudomonadota bacterium]
MMRRPMMKRLASATLALALSAGIAAAQDPATSPEDMAARQAAAEAYVALPGVQAALDEMFAPAALAENFAASMPPARAPTPEQLETIGDLLAEALTPFRPDLTAAMAEGTAEWFTLEEIAALSAFYESDVGASVMRKFQPYMRDVMTQVWPKLFSAQRAALPAIMKELRAP